MLTVQRVLMQRIIVWWRSDFWSAGPRVAHHVAMSCRDE